MRRGFRPPLALFAAALLGLIALLATLQYQWLGRISDAERERMPALVVPAPVLLIDERITKPDVRFMPFMSYTILVLDRDYLTGEVLPALAQQHFGVTAAPAGARTVATLKSYSTVDYRLAVLRESGGAVMYHSVADYSPAPDAAADVSVALFQVKPQDFVELASELRRFVTFRTSAGKQIPNQAPNHAPNLA